MPDALTTLVESQVPAKHTPPPALAPDGERTSYTPARDAVAQRRWGAKGPTPAPAAKPAPARQPAAELEPDKPETPDIPPPDKPIEKPDAQPDEKPAETVPADKPDETPAKGQKKTPWQLVRDFEKKVKDLTAQLEAKSKPVEDPKVKEITEQLAAERAARQKVEDELRYKAYEQHPEFQKQYWEPYKESWETASAAFSELEMLDAEGNTRQATPKDFEMLYDMRLRDRKNFFKTIETSFGPGAAGAIEAQMLDVEKQARRMNHAREDFRNQGLAKQKEADEQRMSQHKAIAAEVGQKYTAHYEAVPKEFPEIFAPVPGDEKGNKELEAGYAMSKKAFAKLNPFAPGLTPEERDEMLRLHAETAHFAAASRRLVHWRKVDQQTIATLKQKLAEYEKSEPKASDVATARQTAPAENRNSSFLKRLQQGRRG